jgi:hypothetical protein
MVCMALSLLLCALTSTTYPSVTTMQPLGQVDASAHVDKAEMDPHEGASVLHPTCTPPPPRVPTPAPAAHPLAHQHVRLRACGRRGCL